MSGSCCAALGVSRVSTIRPGAPSKEGGALGKCKTIVPRSVDISTLDMAGTAIVLMTSSISRRLVRKYRFPEVRAQTWRTRVSCKLKADELLFNAASSTARGSPGAYAWRPNRTRSEAVPSRAHAMNSKQHIQGAVTSFVGISTWAGASNDFGGVGVQGNTVMNRRVEGSIHHAMSTFACRDQWMWARSKCAFAVLTGRALRPPPEET
mmetsp:Transcript_8683/g.22462  ORF Transcript_8683/g.22462 Transcript_8683/m.22462 type:complete len:208 (-) Transcript_8683:898-1521(-)